jgi:hypothetical protein
MQASVFASVERERREAPRVTRDAVFGGRVALVQPARGAGYRVTGLASAPSGSRCSISAARNA